MCGLPEQLVESGGGHGGVDAEEIPVPGFDDEAIARPDDAGGGDHRLLRIRQHLRRLGEVGYVGYAEAPLERWCPEVDRLRARRVVPKSQELRIYHFFFFFFFFLQFVLCQKPAGAQLISIAISYDLYYNIKWGIF